MSSKRLVTLTVACLCACLTAGSTFGLGSLLCAISGAHAAEAPWAAATGLSIPALLLPPPCDDCAETRAELAELLELQRSRSDALALHARNDYERSPSRLLDAPEIGMPVEHLRECVPCNKFFDRLEQSVEAITAEAKKKFNRTRPYNLPGNNLIPLKAIEPEDTSSYPSGHAAFATLAGIVLAQILPEKQVEIFRRVEDFCHSRLVAGVHFRSDVYAGQVVGSTMAALLLRDPDFRRDFEAARGDVRKALGL